MMSVIGAELSDVLVQRPDGKRVDAGIDLVLVRFIAAQCLLLNDALDLIGRLAFDHAAKNPSVAGGIVRLGREHGHSCMVCDVKIADARDGLRRDQRNIARQHQHMLERRQRCARFHHGVTGAALLALQHESDAGGFQRRADLVRLMPDDGEDALRGNHLRRRRHHMRQQRLAANLVQDFGKPRLQPRALAGGEDGNREALLLLWSFLRHVSS